MKRKNQGFTLIEVLIVLAIIGMLLVMLLPAIASVQEKANGMDCLSNLRQFAVAIEMYADEHDNMIPAVTELGDYLDNPGVFVCPMDTRDGVGQSKPSYTTNIATPNSILPADINGIYSEQITLVESDQAGIKDPSEIRIEDVTIRHGALTYVLYLDGHVEGYAEDQLAQLLVVGPGESKVPTE